MVTTVVSNTKYVNNLPLYIYKVILINIIKEAFDRVI